MTADRARATVRAAFTIQAASYAASAVVADRERRRWFVDLVDPPPDARVLDVATGPGFTALAFAARVRLVLGVDLTPAMLAQARAGAGSLPPGTGGGSFYVALGDAAALPVAGGAFDVVTCGNALHHFPAVEPVLRELRRACKPGGVVAISDLVSDEDPARAAEHNAIERLRDPSHVRSLPASELVALLERHGCAVRSVTTTATRRGLGEWLAIARTPPEAAAEVRRRLEATIADDGAGLDVAWEDGPEGPELRFTHTTAWIVAGVEGRERPT